MLPVLRRLGRLLMRLRLGRGVFVVDSWAAGRSCAATACAVLWLESVLQAVLLLAWLHALPQAVSARGDESYGCNAAGRVSVLQCFVACTSFGAAAC